MGENYRKAYFKKKKPHPSKPGESWSSKGILKTYDGKKRRYLAFQLNTVFIAHECQSN